MRTRRQGQVLPIVMGTLLVLMIFIGAIVAWIQSDTKLAVKDEKTTTAFNLAQAGIDRACWKLQSTTTTWVSASTGTAITGYNFDVTYYDVPGGTYRMKISSGPTSGNSCTTNANCVTIVAEGRDSSTNEVRALSTIYANETIYSGLMAQGNVTWSPGLGLFWGPIIAQGNITLQNGIDAWYFPLKYAKGDVIGTATNPRDTSYPNPPNTDGVEWWANYAGVPSTPLLDFTALRSSAAATGTLNIYGCKNSTFHGASTGTPDQGGTAGAAPWDLNSSCSLSPGDITPHNQHFGDSTNYVRTYLNTSQQYVWYWDGDVTLTGQFNGTQPYCQAYNNCGANGVGRSTALWGTVIVLGNLTIDSPGDFIYTGHVPQNAWQQENKLTKTTYDTSASNEYPADTGLHSSASLFCFGNGCAGWCVPTPPTVSCSETATVGIRGFLYVGKNLYLDSYLDINGALWVNGNVNATNGSYTTFTSVFYDDTLSVPALNVILIRQQWQEIPPSSTAWP